MERAHDPDAKFETVTFDLATGTKVRVALDEFWEQLSESDRRLGAKPSLYFAIRVYSDEDSNPRRLQRCDEFRAGNDFDQCALHRLWPWLNELARSRHRFAYDRVEDFLEEFVARMDEFSTIGEDIADRFHKSHWRKPPLPYEDPPPAEFPEDEFANSARDHDDEIRGEDADDLGDDESQVALEESGGNVLSDTEIDEDESEGER